MASLGQAKTLGGVGSILVLLSPIPYAGAVLSIVGFIMILIAVKYIADILGDQKIFNNMIIAVVLAIIGIVVGVVVVLGAVYSLIGLGSYTYTPGTTTLPTRLLRSDSVHHCWAHRDLDLLSHCLNIPEEEL